MEQFRILYKLNPNKFISKNDINEEIVKLYDSIPSIPATHEIIAPSVSDIYTYINNYNDSISEIFSQKNLSVIKLVPLITGEFSSTNTCTINIVSNAIDIGSHSESLTNFFVNDSIYTHSDSMYSFEGDKEFSITVNFKYDYLLNQDEYYIIKVNGKFYATKTATIDLASTEEIVSVGTYLYKNNQGDTATIDSITALKYIRNGITNIETSPIIKNKKINYIHIEEVFIGKNSTSYPITTSVKCLGIENNSEFTIRNISGSGKFNVLVNDREVKENDVVKNNDGFIKVILRDKNSSVDYINIEEVL